MGTLSAGTGSGSSFTGISGDLMGYKRRQAQRIAAMHEWYESPSGQEEAMGGEIDSLGWEASFPGPRETRILDSTNLDHRLDTSLEMVPTMLQTRDMVEWDAGGVAGYTKAVGSIGVTDPQTVETHTWDRQGQMAVVRRMPDTNYGPVKTSDHNSLLALLYATQETANFFPNEISQIDVIRAV